MAKISLVTLFVTLLCLAVTVGSIASTVRAQAPIPTTPDGYPLGPYGAPVVIDIFVDLMCPDSAAAFPVILQAVGSYNGQVQALLHFFPLPYHTNSFFANQGAHVIANATQNATTVYQYASAFFLVQGQWYNDATQNWTIVAVKESIAAWTEAQGFLSSSKFLAGLASDDLNEDLRVSWKYACSRAVLATPTFLVNGVFVAADPSWTVADWQSLIDSLLEPSVDASTQARRTLQPAPVSAATVIAHPTFHETVNANITCPSGETLCEYLPNEYECCLAGENCIKNVGCRCLDEEPKLLSIEL